MVSLNCLICFLQPTIFTLFEVIFSDNIYNLYSVLPDLAICGYLGYFSNHLATNILIWLLRGLLFKNCQKPLFKLVFSMIFRFQISDFWADFDVCFWRFQKLLWFRSFGVFRNLAPFCSIFLAALLILQRKIFLFFI